MLPTPNAPAFTGRRRRSIGCDHKAVGARYGSGLATEMQPHKRRLLKSLQKSSHQRSVVKNPADPVMAAVLFGQIIRNEQHLMTCRKITKVELFEGHQILPELIPNAQALHESTAGMGNGVGTTTRCQCVKGLRVKQNHALVLLR